MMPGAICVIKRKARQRDGEKMGHMLFHTDGLKRWYLSRGVNEDRDTAQKPLRGGHCWWQEMIPRGQLTGSEMGSW